MSQMQRHREMDACNSRNTGTQKNKRTEARVKRTTEEREKLMHGAKMLGYQIAPSIWKHEATMTIKIKGMEARRK